MFQWLKQVIPAKNNIRFLRKLNRDFLKSLLLFAVNTDKMIITGVTILPKQLLFFNIQNNGQSNG